MTWPDRVDRAPAGRHIICHRTQTCAAPLGLRVKGGDGPGVSSAVADFTPRYLPVAPMGLVVGDGRRQLRPGNLLGLPHGSHQVAAEDLADLLLIVAAIEQRLRQNREVRDVVELFRKAADTVEV